MFLLNLKYDINYSHFYTTKVHLNIFNELCHA